MRFGVLHLVHMFTFRDRDGSVAQAAAIKPHNACPIGGCPVLLTLSGVGVSPQRQADSYKCNLI